jgi:simple sugar transport system ATP-binding protein
VRELSERYRLDVDPDALVGDLPVGVQQRVEILKALVHDVDVLILDEPTAVLTPQEIDELIRVMRELRGAGKSIVFITHKLREVKAVADRITVIRRGKVVGDASPQAAEGELASLMVGRDVQLVVDKSPAKAGEVALRIAGLTIRDDRGSVTVDDLSLDVQAGEIVGLAGVQGNGQEELVESLLGVREPESGSITLNGAELVGRSPRHILAGGLGYVPEDRQQDGLVGSFTVAENLVLDMYDREPYGSGLGLRLGDVRRNAEKRVEEFDIRTPSIDATAGTLSGGNQQKVVLAREMSRPLKLFVASQPTRGVDVGAQEFIHRRIIAERDNGTPVVIVSTELDEVLALADRIAVMYRGRIIGVLPAGASRDEVGLMMAGVAPEQAHAEAEEHPSELTAVEQQIAAEQQSAEQQSAEPRTAQPPPVEPLPAEPQTAQPTAAKSTAAEAPAAEPQPVDPDTVEPAAAEPHAVEPPAAERETAEQQTVAPQVDQQESES